jgi:amidase
MMPFSEWSVIQLAQAIATRQVSAREVTEYALHKIETLNPETGAFVWINHEDALSQADMVDKQIAAGTPPSRIAGIPCPIKDLAAVQGKPWQMGSVAFQDNIAQYSDPMPQWLAQAGTIMVGKTNTPEFGLPPYTEPDHCPPARTPYDVSRTAGGSSGGAAAAVAAGMTPMAHGSDGGGSLRIPASCCNLVGFKPSRGLIPSADGPMPGPGLLTEGLLTKSVADMAFALDAIIHPQIGETYYMPWPEKGLFSALNQPLPPLRIGVLTTPVITPDEPVDPACLAAVTSTVTLLENLGHKVSQAPIPFEAEQWAAFEALWAVMALTIPVPESLEHKLTPLTRTLREKGRTTTGLEYAQAVLSQQQMTRQVALRWAEFDAILTPTLARIPPKIGAIRNDADPQKDFYSQMVFTPWTSTANITGRPSISVPGHWAEVEGKQLPIGIMLTGRLGQDTQLLGLAAQVEKAITSSPLS